MKTLQLMLHDRRRRQSGSVLSGLLIIVAFLAILVGAVLSELSGSLVLSRDLVTRVKTEATVSSAAELAIHQLQGGPVPAVCVRDARGPWFLKLNGLNAAVMQTCNSILPEEVTSLPGGPSTVDGIHDTGAGRNRYLITDLSGRLTAYAFGQSLATWSTSLGGAATAPPLTAADPNGSVDILTPIGSRVAVINEHNGAQNLGCNLSATAAVKARAADEVAVGGSLNFQGYAFFGDAYGHLFVY